MKKIFLFSIASFLTLLMACSGPGHKKEGDAKGPKSLADSLMADVMDGHDAGMAKYGKLGALQKKIQAMLDSIASLPGRAKEAAAPLKAKLDGLLKDLSSAKEGMEKWMDEFNMDSALNNMEERVKYLKDEKLKVGKVKETILNSLQKADSVLREKF